MAADALLHSTDLSHYDRQVVHSAALFVFDSINGAESVHPLTDHSFPLIRKAHKIRLDIIKYVRLVSVFSVCLTFFEYPGWCRDPKMRVIRDDPCDSDLYPTYVNAIGYLSWNWNLALEVMFLVPLLVDAMLVMYSQGCKRAFSLTRQWVRFILLLLLIGDMCWVYLRPYPRVFRLAPYFRIGICIGYTPQVKKRLTFIVSMLPQLTPIFFLLVAFLVAFAWFGVLLFPGTTGEGQQYFDGIADGMWSLLVLLTTANYPDVMMPAYKLGRATFLFFATFICIGCFLLVNLVTAVVFNAFGREKEHQKKNTQEVRSRCRDEAFRLLAGINGKGNEIDVKLMKELFAELNLYHDIAYINDERAHVYIERLDQDHDGAIEKEEFVNITRVLKSSIELPLRPPLLERWYPQLKENAHWTKLKYAVTSTVFDLMIDFVLLISVVLTFFESCKLGLLVPQDDRSMEVAEESKPYVLGISFSTFTAWEAAISFVFVIEVILKLLVLGRDTYWSGFLNQYDFTITMLTAAITVYVLIPNDHAGTRIIRCAAELRLFRSVRLLLHASTHMTVIAQTFVKMIPDIFGMIKVLLYVMFTFSVLGMQLFGGVINTDPKSPYSAPLADTDYAQADYFANNFNDMPSGMVTLFELLVVNNWFVIVDGFSAASGWPHGCAALFFVAWYIFGILIAMNIVISFILGSFVDIFETQLEARQTHPDDRDGLAVAIRRMHTGEGLNSHEMQVSPGGGVDSFHSSFGFAEL